MRDNVHHVSSLFEQEVPEIAAGDVLIMAIARIAGSWSKLALQSQDPHVDCIAVCVGVKGSRIKKIMNSLGDERIDMVLWHDSPEDFIASALQPARIEKVVLKPAEHRAVVRVKHDQLSWALGPKGENRLLASELSGWLIEIENFK